MKPINQPQVKEKYDYGSLLVAALILLTISQGIEGIQTPIGNFIRGVAIGLSIVCSLIGLVLYMQSHKK